MTCPGPPHRVRNISCKSETWIPLQKSQGLPFRAEENCLLSHSPLKPRIRSTNFGSTSSESQNIPRKHPTQSSTMDHKQPQETSQCDRHSRVPSTRHPRRKKAPSKTRAPVQDPSWWGGCPTRRTRNLPESTCIKRPHNEDKTTGSTVYHNCQGYTFCVSYDPTVEPATGVNNTCCKCIKVQESALRALLSLSMSDLNISVIWPWPDLRLLNKTRQDKILKTKCCFHFHIIHIRYLPDIKTIPVI